MSTETTNSMQTELRKYVSPEFVFGQGALDMVSQYAVNFGAGKALIVTDPGIRVAGWTGRVEAALQRAAIPYAIFDGLTSNPKDYCRVH
ncbi:MAG: iron-containing alcohol dehydrogenase [Chloroflexi bacterium]|nr:iron-containing alcohol dehydrogenase [Chloroflexota bacterium]